MHRHGRSLSRSISSSLLATALVACTGKILSDDNAAPQASQPESPGAIDWTDPEQGPIGPGASYLRRLTNAEYSASVHDLLDQQGEVTDLAALYDLVPDTRVHGFESNATNVNMSAAVLERYRVAAEAISKEVVEDDATREHVLGCEPQGDPECVAGFIEAFGRRAYRRRLDADEIARLIDLSALAADGREGVKLVLQHFLLSPNFLFRIEEGQADDARRELLKLRGNEIATRLSYLLLGTTPAAALLDAAEAGELDTAAGVDAAARALFGEARARPSLRRFYDQWLRLDRVASLTRDPEVYPEFDVELARSMRDETNHLLDDLIWQPGRNFLDFVSSSQTSVDARLAKFYGLPAVDGWQAAQPGRAGVLGHAGLLAQTSRRDRTSSTLRGKYLREVLLCYPLPALPANIPPLPTPGPDQSEQQRLAAHTSDPTCAGCHQLLDPLGFGLDGFDAIGRFRELDERGQPIDTAGRVEGYPALEQPAFDGALELAQRLRELPELGQCVVTQLFRHGFARLEQPADNALLGAARSAFEASGYSFQELVVAFVTSDAFRYRERPEAEEGWQ